MARYIDADKLLENLEELTNDTWNESVAPRSWVVAYEEMIEMVQNEPTADVVEVVRCKDCRYCDEYGRCEAPENGLIREYVKPKDYCSYGERRDA